MHVCSGVSSDGEKLGAGGRRGCRGREIFLFVNIIYSQFVLIFYLFFIFLFFIFFNLWTAMSDAL